MMTIKNSVSIAFRITSLLVAATYLSGCAWAPRAQPSPAPELHLQASPDWSGWHRQLAQWHDARVILLGEQHDAPEHHALERETVRQLAAQQRLAALVLEMADAGTHTRELAASASEAEVQRALGWKDAGWPWADYGPAIMEAVRAGVPVLGGNLPRSAMGQAMKEERFDHTLGPAELQLQLDAIREGHCDLLPESQWLPMARIQLAKDESMAQAIQSAIQPGRTVLLIAGGGHVRERLGVPRWLSADVKPRTVMMQAGAAPTAARDEASIVVVTPALPPKDHCAELRRQWRNR